MGGAADREALEAVTAALAAIGDEFRAALLLHVQEGLAYRDVARILNTTEETARWRVFKARQKLLKILPADILPTETK
jgi:RNA polymerase sigma-70 factor (ECF subfamily)